MPEHDLAGHRDKADHAQCPSGGARREPNLDQVFGLVDLHGVPGEEAAEISNGDPPEAGCAQRPHQGPFHRRPVMVDDVPATLRGRCSWSGTVGNKSEILGPLPQQQVRRYQQDENENAERPARSAPTAFLINDCSQGSSVTEPTPTPEKAMLSARLRRRQTSWSGTATARYRRGS